MDRANSSRTSHYPYSEEVLDLADRRGLLVIDETAALVRARSAARRMCPRASNRLLGEYGQPTGAAVAEEPPGGMLTPVGHGVTSAEITGDVVVGEGSIIGAEVKITGDRHGPVRIGARVQILENAVLHVLSDNQLIVEDDVVIGPGAMIHGCHLGAGTVVEPAAIVCDSSRVGAQSVVRAGACVKQRARFGERAVLDGSRRARSRRWTPPRPGPRGRSTPTTYPGPSRQRHDVRAP